MDFGFLEILKVVVIFVCLFLIVISIKLKITEDNINRKEDGLIELFYGKINKIPALVEIMKKYTRHPDVFEEVIYLHKLSIISRINGIYDMLELNYRLQKEFMFLMKLSTKIKNIHRDGNYVYIRDFIMFYESNIGNEINDVNLEIARFNKLLFLKNLTLFGFAINLEEKMKI